MLIKSVDYTVRFYNNKDVGKAEFIIKGKGNYARHYLYSSFLIVSADEDYDGESADLKGARLVKPGPMTYTGEALYPDELILQLKGKGKVSYSLKADGNYESADGSRLPACVTFSNNINKGTAAVLLSGANGTRLRTSFAIKAADLSKAEQDDLLIKVDEAAYAVKGAVPAVEVTYKDIKLIEGVDYTVKYSYSNRKNAGSDAGTVTVTGKGNFTKKAQPISFDITPLELDDDSVIAVNAYKGINSKAVKVMVFDGNNNEIPAKYFDISIFDVSGTRIEGRLPEGDYILEVMPKSDNLTGGSTVDIHACELNLSKAKVKRSPVKNYTGEAIELDENDMLGIKVSIKNDELVYGEDYEIAGYMNNIKAGKMTVILKGIGERCSGIKKFNVRIASKRLP